MPSSKGVRHRPEQGAFEPCSSSERIGHSLEGPVHDWSCHSPGIAFRKALRARCKGQVVGASCHCQPEICALCSWGVNGQRESAIRTFTEMNQPHILHVVVISVLLAPFGASAQTDEDSHVPFGLTCDVVQVEGEEHDLVFNLDLGPGHSRFPLIPRTACLNSPAISGAPSHPIDWKHEELPPSAWRWNICASWTSKSSVKTRGSSARFHRSGPPRRIEGGCSSF